MAMTDPSREATEEAAAWAARLGAPDCTDEDRQRFRVWRECSEHDRAYRAAEQLDERLRQLPAHDLRVARLARNALQGSAANSRARRFLPRLPLATVAASLAAAAMMLAVTRTNRPRTLVPIAPVAYETAAAEVATAILKDGSTVHLDVDSRIEVSFDGQSRVVKLLRGRAYFAVTHDPTRSFVVEAGKGRLRDVGTRFQVERATGGDHQVAVILAEGALDVTAHGDSPAVAHIEHMRVGEELSYSDDAATWLKRTVDPEIATSWTHGRLVFRDAPLSEALDTINRYAHHKVRLGDPNMKIAVSGTFALGDSLGFAEALSEAFPLRLASNPRGEIVLVARSQTSASSPPHP